MCTVTVVPRQASSASSKETHFRVTCNRDEQRSRPKARPPVHRTLGTYAVLMPIDPVSDGTWIGVNEAGLVVCLLNANPAPELPSTRSPWVLRRSRGEIAPTLLAHNSVQSATIACLGLRAQNFPPFALFLCTSDNVAVIASDGDSMSVTEHGAPSRPLILTSSGLGDRLVEPPRRRLFENAVVASENWLAGQERYHATRDLNEPHLGVLMARSDARTVSRTLVDVCRDTVLMDYCALAEDLSPVLPSVKCSLSLRQARVLQ